MVDHCVSHKINDTDLTLQSFWNACLKNADDNLMNYDGLSVL